MHPPLSETWQLVTMVTTYMGGGHAIIQPFYCVVACVFRLHSCCFPGNHTEIHYIRASCHVFPISLSLDGSTLLQWRSLSILSQLLYAYQWIVSPSLHISTCLSPYFSISVSFSLGITRIYNTALFTCNEVTTREVLIVSLLYPHQLNHLHHSLYFKSPLSNLRSTLIVY